MTKRLLPEIKEGTRVQYASPRNGATYCGVVARRSGNALTIKRTASTKQRIHVKNITGHWPPRVKATPEKMIKIER